MIRDAQGNITKIKTKLTGKQLLSTSNLNKDNGFTNDERKTFKLTGKLPDAVETIEEQASRLYQQYSENDSNLKKNIYLNQVFERNRTLFYYLVGQHLEEMLPIVYTPTIGEAVEKFSLELRDRHGLFISYDNKDNIEEILDNYKNHGIDLILVTDGEGVLGIGDQGIGGMDIAIGKLMVYTLCAGVNPHRVLPIQLDVGTNNEKLLNDPMYLGMRKKRITGKAYNDFVDTFVETVMKKFPNIYLHWEDFGRSNARSNLERWRPKLLTFNDDMQGTGATSLACGLSAVAAKNETLKEQRIVFFGAGTAGCGIADQYCAAMINQGLSKEEACSRIYLIDRPGLLVEDMKEVQSFQAPYAKSRKEIDAWKMKDPHAISLLDTIKHSKATILVGCSGVHGAFSDAVIKAMADNAQHPIIFPLSNPTSLSEAEPKTILELTEGRAIVATGSPFDDVNINGRNIRISQSNNAFVFPGLGLGAMAVKAKHMTDNMIHAACEALSELSPARKDKSAPVLPDINNAREVSLHIARAVAQQAIDDGEAQACDVELAIQQIHWQAQYYPYEKE
ncbi:MAG: NAD-dependent malic enzyme [Gammaproteobacteria bacterium]|nr:NAD-dependent malic enzyme [Gammaproteobacteria bacterium]